MSQTEEQGDLNSPTVQPDTLYELAYNAAVDVLKQQDATLANMRNRASGLLATAALAASFATSVGLFGAGATGSKPIPHQYGWVLLATVILIGVASSIVLWPVQRWGYGPNTTDLRRAGSHEAVTWDQLDRIHLRQRPSASCDPRAMALGEWRSQTVHSGHLPGPPEGNQGRVCARQRIAYRCQGRDRTADLALFRPARPRIAVVSMAASGSSSALAENTQVKSQVTGGGQGVGVILA